MEDGQYFLSVPRMGDPYLSFWSRVVHDRPSTQDAVRWRLKVMFARGSGPLRAGPTRSYHLGIASDPLKGPNGETIIGNATPGYRSCLVVAFRSSASASANEANDRLAPVERQIPNEG